MKRVLMLITVAVLAAALFGCGDKLIQKLAPTTLATTEATTEPTAAPTTEATTEATTEPTTEATTEPTEVTTSQGLQFAPDFTVFNREGEPVRLSDYRGKPVVLNFWASWCGPCKSEMPTFQMAYDYYGDSVEFLFVNLTDGNTETAETAYGYVDSQGYTFPVYLDTTSEATIKYGISAIPTTYFIDAEGGAVAYYSGALDYDTLMVGLDMIDPSRVQETAPSTEETQLS